MKGHLSRTQKLILKSLRKGKSAAVSRYDLAERFGMTEQAVRRDLASLTAIYPICGGYGTSGYYLGCKSEVSEYIGHLTNHIKGMQHRLRSMRKFI